VLQLGTLALIPYAGQLLLEIGFLRTVMELFEQLLTGSLVLYTFQQQTVAQSFMMDLSYGGQRYVCAQVDDSLPARPISCLAFDGVVGRQTCCVCPLNLYAI